MLFTSESVTEGHPDKMCDQISDAILDTILKNDPYAHVACETTVSDGIVFITGEITSKIKVNIEKIARQTIKEIGYTKDEYGFNVNNCSIIASINEQSPDIARGVNKDKEIGAGDQGLMFGYASDETPELMPLPITLAHKLAKRLTKVRKNNKLSYLRPDGKTQVTVEYKDHEPKRIDSIVISAQHNPDIKQERLKKDIIGEVIRPVLPNKYFDSNITFFINPTGRFVIGGPKGDSGVTGRKIMVDTYGGMAKHGGGAFSGKDPTKVDRSAAYALRYISKNLVAEGLVKKCEIQAAYVIGVPEPVSLSIETFGTAKVSEKKLIKIIKKNFELNPRSIIENLKLRRPIYKKIAVYGHFGRSDLNLPWEKEKRLFVNEKQTV